MNNSEVFVITRRWLTCIAFLIRCAMSFASELAQMNKRLQSLIEKPHCASLIKTLLLVFMRMECLMRLFCVSNGRKFNLFQFLRESSFIKSRMQPETSSRKGSFGANDWEKPPSAFRDRPNFALKMKVSLGNGLLEASKYPLKIKSTCGLGFVRRDIFGT
jgi:hypothetical protein